MARTSEDEIDGTRRALATVFGALGVAMLGGCGGAESTGGGNSPGRVEEEVLRGPTTQHWFKTVYGSGSLSEFRADVGHVALVAGRTEIGDGGGGLFVWTADVDACDDGGTVVVPAFVPPAARTGAWKRISDGPFNVKWFGARGDGVTIDTAAIDRALAALGPAGTLYFPSGVYLVDAPIDLRVEGGGRTETLVLRGDGAPEVGTDLDVSFCPASPRRGTILRAKAPSPVDAVLIVESFGPTVIEGITFDGNFIAKAVLRFADHSVVATVRNCSIMRALPSYLQPDSALVRFGGLAGEPSLGAYTEEASFESCKIVQDEADASARAGSAIWIQSSESFLTSFRCCLVAGADFLVLGSGNGSASFAFCNFSLWSSACFRLASPQSFEIANSYSEYPGVLIDFTPPFIDSSVPIVFRCNEFNAALNSQPMTFHLNQPVLLEANQFNGQIFLSPDGKMPFLAIGNSFTSPSSTFLRGTPSTSISADVESIPNFQQIGTVTLGATDTNVVNTVRSKSGSVSFSATGTTQDVVFATPEHDDTYVVLLGLVAAGATSAIASPYVTAQSTGGFTITLPPSPGIGGVTVNWVLARGA
jgi:hypothetical protein